MEFSKLYSKAICEDYVREVVQSRERTDGRTDGLRKLIFDQA